MMYQKGAFGYAAHPELLAHVLELPYGNENRLSMYILLPRKGKDIQQILKKIFSRCIVLQVSVYRKSLKT